MNLNTGQQQAVDSTAATVVVCCGPGGGKTKVIVERIREGVRLGHYTAADTVVLTFTNSAAREIEERLEAHGLAVGYVGTLHGWCFRLLQQHGHLISYRKNKGITILSEEAREVLLKEVKNRLGYPKVSAKAIADEITAPARAIMAEFRHTMKRQNMVDYDGILEAAKKLLFVLPKEATGVGALFVDECQDSGETDWIIYRSIFALFKTYAGDPDQSIFAFRGAKPAQFILQSQVAGTQLVRLERNYRSAPAICQLANDLIAHNTGRIEKTINPEFLEVPATIEVVPIDVSRNEPLEIARILRQAFVDAQIPYEEMAVLARTNLIADEIRQTLREMNVPVAEQAKKIMPADWSFCLTTLQLMLDPSNDILAEKYLLHTGTPMTTVNRLKIETMKRGLPLLHLGIPPVMAVGGGLFNYKMIGLPARLAQAGVSPESVAIVHARREALPDCAKLPDLISDLWKSDQWDEQPKTEGVTVTTIHKAKGREFDLVVIAGCEEGILPSNAKNEDVEESRRLCFVGVTRARRALFFTHCKRRFAYGKMTDQTPSRFLSEMGLCSSQPMAL